MAYQLQNEHYIFVRYLFSQPVIFSSDPFCYSLLRISFAEVIPKNCKEVVDLRFVHPNAAQLSGIFFSKSTDTKLVYILVGSLLTSCSLLSACFSFSLFLFCLPNMCSCAIFRENQNKCKPSIYTEQYSEYEFYSFGLVQHLLFDSVPY